MTARRHLDDARVAVAVGYVDVSLRVPGNVSGAVKRTDRSFWMWVPGAPAGVVKARAAAFEEFLEIIDGFRRATKLFLGHALGIEFDDHARTLVDHPDVIVFVDAHG